MNKAHNPAPAFTDADVHNAVIIGSGPAGWTAAIYLAREQLAPLVISGNDPGGQLMLTTTIENFPGFPEPIGGGELMDRMRKQAVVYGTVVLEDHVSEVDFSSHPFVIKTTGGRNVLAKAVIVSTGSYAKWLGLESEEKFRGYGVSGCAVCDGLFFMNKKVAVVGGGNTAIEEALHLAKTSKEVLLLARSDALKGEAIMVKELLGNKAIKVIYNTQVEEFLGVDDDSGKYLTGIMVKNNISGDVSKIDVDGVFVAIGHKPNSDLFLGKLSLDAGGYIVTEGKSTKTSVDGVFAAGDVQDPHFKQAVTSAGTGCIAALELSDFVSKLK